MARTLPFQVTTVRCGKARADAAVKVNVSGLQRWRCLGEMLVRVNGVAVMVNGSAFEVCVPFSAATEAEPADGDEIRRHGRNQLRVRRQPRWREHFHSKQVTTVPAEKPEPFAVNVNVGPPAVALLGEMLVSINGAVMVNGSAFDVSVPFRAATEAEPADAMKLAGTVAVNCEPETKEVARTLPFQVTSVLAVKPEPFAVNVNVGPPAVALLGEMLVSVNEVAVMLKVSAF